MSRNWPSNLKDWLNSFCENELLILAQDPLQFCQIRQNWPKLTNLRGNTDFGVSVGYPHCGHFGIKSEDWMVMHWNCMFQLPFFKFYKSMLREQQLCLLPCHQSLTLIPKYFAVLRPLVSPACLWMMQVNIWSRSPPQFGSNRTSTFQMRPFFTFSAYLTTWPQMTFYLGIWPLTAWTYEGSQ